MPREDVEHVEERDKGFIRTRKVPKAPQTDAVPDDRLAAIETQLADMARRLVALEKPKK